jgi:hypothetical protein
MDILGEDVIDVDALILSFVTSEAAITRRTFLIILVKDIYNV